MPIDVQTQLLDEGIIGDIPVVVSLVRQTDELTAGRGKDGRTDVNAFECLEGQ
jgi:hypothetical protein